MKFYIEKFARKNQLNLNPSILEKLVSKTLNNEYDYV